MVKMTFLLYFKILDENGKRADGRTVEQLRPLCMLLLKHLSLDLLL